MAVAHDQVQEIYCFRARTPADTQRLADALGAVMEANSVLALDGDLGAGKTTFSQMLATQLGVEEVVNSPTFTIIKEYDGREFPFYHMDVYRLDENRAAELGLDEYFYGGGVTVIEWASLIAGLLPEQHLEIRIESPSDERLFYLLPHGEPYVNWCRAWYAQALIEKKGM